VSIIIGHIDVSQHVVVNIPSNVTGGRPPEHKSPKKATCKATAIAALEGGVTMDSRRAQDTVNHIISQKLNKYEYHGAKELLNQEATEPANSIWKEYSRSPNILIAAKYAFTLIPLPDSRKNSRRFAVIALVAVRPIRTEARTPTFIAYCTFVERSSAYIKNSGSITTSLNGSPEVISSNKTSGIWSMVVSSVPSNADTSVTAKTMIQASAILEERFLQASKKLRSS